MSSHISCNMKTYVFLYDNFAAFEIAVATMLLRKKGDVITFAQDTSPIVSEEGLTVVPDMATSSVNPAEVDVLIFPGGNPRPHSQDEALIALIRSVNERNVPIGAICAGPLFLADAGILIGKRCTSGLRPDYPHMPAFDDAEYSDCFHVVRDGNIVTSTGNAFVDFAIVVSHAAQLFETVEEEIETYLWLMNEE